MLTRNAALLSKYVCRIKGWIYNKDNSGNKGKAVAIATVFLLLSELSLLYNTYIIMCSA